MSSDSISFDVFRGVSGKIVADRVTKSLGDNEIFIETTHSGLCGTDLHFLHSNKVLGHEGVGIVRRLGPGVTSVKVGDRVGFGYTRKVCGKCKHCLSGWDQFCENIADFTNRADPDIGSLSNGAVWDADAVVRVPNGYDSSDAAPLLCAGATVWTVLTEYGIKPTDRVGILGIGGLGHLAIKLASALGCHVVVLSSSESKRQEAFEFGAKEYFVLKSGEKPSGLLPLDHLLVCGSSSSMDYTFLVSLMEIHGSIYPLTVSSDKVPILLHDAVLKGVRVQGSLTSSRRSLRRLFEFVAERDIHPTLQKFPMSVEGIETAAKVLDSGKMRYRGVLCWN
ncbi:putative alcohol dehydrogenase [Talaromyces proteolyticus]|uniref:Alcohol dehydrogenase n=1 Tax=Talaromyces proteolyticus TaxID=1131652 RepID=A0AAD4Q541_9EURO|nr:putative alcohol dehydrogenase [Talaromyces proteolyticus]KAH8703640.1 putative alcohol dehydrogenase [Talaromyces proteolyticus]